VKAIMQAKRLFAIFALITLPFMFSVSAQAAICTIDLSSIVAELLQAQATASGGDAEASLAQIAEVRAALAAITTACAEAGVDVGVVLDNRFVAPNNSFTVDYPSGWVEGNFSTNAKAGAILLGSTPTAAQALNTSIPQLASGEQALVVAVGSANTFGVGGENPSLEAILQQFAERSLADFETTGELEMSSLEDRSVGRMEFGGESFESVLVGIRLGDRDLYAIVVAVAARGELDSVRRLADAVALSVR
jgi:hypothetical protein